MAFNVREGIRGLHHLQLAACRALFKMDAQTFIEKHKKNGLKIEAVLDRQGSPLKCDRCGFTLMKAELENGWQLECCSAFPVFSLKDQAFGNWMHELAARSLQTKDFPEISGSRSPDAILQDK